MTNQRKRKCKFCGEYVRGWISVPAGTFCNYDHAIEFANQPKIKKATENKIHAEKKARLRDNDRGYWLRSAQTAFNAYIRKRDEGKLCISSGRPLSHDALGGGYDCGHYRSTGAAPHLRFNVFNAHGQSKHDNRYLSGNAVEYRIRLIKRIGLERVERLEKDNTERRYTIDYYKRIKSIFSKKARLYERKFR